MGDADFRATAPTLPLHSEDGMVRLRAYVRQRAIEVGFSLVEQTKIVTAASEIARNTLRYGGGGESRVEVVTRDGRRGLRLEFSDHGPGIVDVERALRDGYSSAGGLGLGLGGARRLVDEFDLHTQPGVGTTVTLIKWKQY